jgi:hypothetical protein
MPQGAIDRVKSREVVWEFAFMSSVWWVGGSGRDELGGLLVLVVCE